MISYGDLRGSLATGDVCAFIGAGLSVGAGLPGWYDLIAELSARIGHKLPPREWASGDALIDAAQTYVNRQGLHSLIGHLKDRLDTTGVQPTAAHRALARLPISLVFTANFDNLLERAFRDAGKRIEVVVKDSSIPFMRRGQDVVNLVKLYGDLDQPDTIVLTRQQYESYFLQRPQMVKLLETELARSDTVYLGWSGADPYFKLVLGELLSRFGQMMRPGYAVMFDVTDDQREELRRKQIRLVELPVGDRTTNLAGWLQGLASSPSSSSPSAPVSLTGGKGDISAAGAPMPALNTGKAWAVLAGANTYEDTHHFGSLQVCVKDVEATREQLIAGGFDPARIRLLTDSTDEKPTRNNILAALKSVADATEPDDLLLFYYSGHGDEAGGESYLVARDGQHLVLRDTAVPVARVKQIMEAAPARAKVILLDACHSGANIGQKGPKPMTKEFIERVFEQAAGMAILASCTQGQFSYEWRGQERSVFTHYLLEALGGEADRDEKGFVTVQDASRHVTDRVKLWASQHNAKQTPTLQYTVSGDIVLTKYPQKSSPPATIQPSSITGYRQRLTRWLRHWTLKKDPFASWNAEKEQAVLRWFMVDQAYLAGMFGDTARPSSSFLLAADGAGKSAAREEVGRACRSGRANALPVHYVDFDAILRRHNGDPTRIEPRDHVAAILRSGLRSLADDVEATNPQFFTGDPSLICGLVETYADPKTLQKLARFLPTASSIVEWKFFEPYEALGNFADIVTGLRMPRHRRYQSVYILVDRINQTSAGVHGALPILKSLVFDSGLLEVPSSAFKFFLPIEIGEQLFVSAPGFRGRYLVDYITWDAELLMKIIQRRISYYSKASRMLQFQELFSPDAKDLLSRLWTGCDSSPRRLLQMCEGMLRYHVERSDKPHFEKSDITAALHRVIVL